MEAVKEMAPRLGVAPTCAALSLPRATYYRHLAPRPTPAPRRAPARALAPAEREAVLAVLHEDRFVDLAPAEVFATLLDEEKYLCSERTLYRVLASNTEVRERRAQMRHPHYTAPQLLATRPNQLWSWDITKLLGPTKWTYYYLYVLLDVFSRYAVGWMLAERETGALAEALIEQSCERQGITPGQLTVHSDNGPAMKSKPVALLMSDLGITKTHSRPHVSNDNPFSESQFKTLKYRPDFPDRFGSQEHGRSFCSDFFPWYNTEHHHVGLGLYTPHDVHFGLADAKRAQRARVLEQAYALHPERFTRGMPKPQAVPSAVWINPPKRTIGAGNTMTCGSDAGAVGAVRSSLEADLGLDPLGITNLSIEESCNTAIQ